MNTMNSANYNWTESINRASEKPGEIHSLIRFIEGDTGEFVESVDTYSQTITKEGMGSQEEKNLIEITIGPSIYTLYFLNRLDWPQWRAA
jgi:hypothetical protein